MHKRIRGLGTLLAATLLASCAAPMATTPAAPADITIDGSRVFPESITSDAAGNLYNSSTSGTIYRTLAGETVARPWITASEQNGLGMLFGVFADDARNLLWVCSNANFFAQPPDTRPATVKAFDLASGQFNATFAFPQGGPVACNDIDIAADGTVWVSETSGGRIFVIRPNANEMELWAQGEELVGIDGIALDDAGTIYINNVRQHLLQRVEKAADGSYADLTNIETALPLEGPDGLRHMGGSRFLQAEGPGGRVAIVTVSGDSATVEPVATGLEGSVGATFVGRTGYAVEGKLNYMLDPALADQSPDPFVIRSFALPETP